MGVLCVATLAPKDNGALELGRILLYTKVTVSYMRCFISAATQHAKNRIIVSAQFNDLAFNVVNRSFLIVEDCVGKRLRCSYTAVSCVCDKVNLPSVRVGIRPRS